MKSDWNERQVPSKAPFLERQGRFHPVNGYDLDNPCASHDASARRPKVRVLSGIRSSGKLHLGNYLGAMKQHNEPPDRRTCFLPGRRSSQGTGC